jgi:hypothetical protein
MTTMQILTTSGYKDIADCAVGDQVSAFDLVTGAPLINTIEALQWVDAAEWARWWQVEPTAPPFQFFRINGTWTLNSEQSIWRNGENVCHAKDLVVGDVIFDDADRDVTITRIEEVTADGWWRFDISGDHSYIVDGLTLHNASRFWVGGTGTWDAATTTHWAASMGAAGGQSVPGSADTVTLDASSGGGTVTLNFGGTITVQFIAMGTFTGTFDNSVNNNNITVTTGTGFAGSGGGVRTIKLGTATYTLSSDTASWNFGTTTNLTYTGNTGANIVFTGASGSRNFAGGGLSHGAVTFGASSGAGFYLVSGSSTLASLSITAPNFVVFTPSTTNTISSAFNWAGSSSSQIAIVSNSFSTAATIAAAASSTASWTAFRDVTFTGSPTASNSFNLGDTSGITITAPSGGGGGYIGS